MVLFKEGRQEAQFEQNSGTTQILWWSMGVWTIFFNVGPYSVCDEHSQTCLVTLSKSLTSPGLGFPTCRVGILLPTCHDTRYTFLTKFCYADRSALSTVFSYIRNKGGVSSNHNKKTWVDRGQWQRPSKRSPEWLYHSTPWAASHKVTVFEHWANYPRCTNGGNKWLQRAE